jgi:hypothetical protein
MTQNEELEYDRKRCSELAESAFDTLDDAMLDVDLALEHVATKSLKEAKELISKAMDMLEITRDGGEW